jgi:pSer/pThr/pTyr-binding forkhead associated (FHA) protein
MNPDGAANCEMCMTDLPKASSSGAMMPCPHCGAPVKVDARFCGHCGNQIGVAMQIPVASKVPVTELTTPLIPPTAQPDEATEINMNSIDPPLIPDNINPEMINPENISPEISAVGNTAPVPLAPEHPELAVSAATAKTQLQTIAASLLHVQTNVPLEIPNNLPVVHIGKPNNVIPPDIDVSGFPDSDIVSRVHADIRFEGDGFYFEDTGSSNGTYINNMPLPPGNRHRLRAGDRISLGKGDKVSFIFQLEG